METKQRVREKSPCSLSRIPPIKSPAACHQLFNPRKKVAPLGGSRRRSECGRKQRQWARLSHPVVHPDPDPAPVEAPAPPAPAPAQGQGNAAPNAPPGVEMRGPIPWAQAGYRLAQALLAAAALAAMASAHDFTSVTAFPYLISATTLQCLWTLALAILFLYALLVGRSFRNPRFFAVLCVGDWIAGSLTFSAACASAGITTFINNDLGLLSKPLSKLYVCYRHGFPELVCNRTVLCCEPRQRSLQITKTVIYRISDPFRKKKKVA